MNKENNDEKGENAGDPQQKGAGEKSSSLEKQFILNATSPKPFQEGQREKGRREQSSTAGEARFEQVREKVKKEAETKHAKEEEKLDQKRKSIISPLRTYKDDIVRAIRRQKESYVSVLAAESKMRAQRTGTQLVQKQYSQTARQLITISLLLLAVGGASVLIFYLASLGDGKPALAEIPSLIFTEEQREIDITGKGRTGIMRDLIDEGKVVDGVLGSLSQFYLTEFTVRGKRFTSAGNFLRLLEVRAPSSFLRALEHEMTIGVHVVNGNQPFFIFKVNSFDNAFAGMLLWEDDIDQDLSPLFGRVLGSPDSGIVNIFVGSAFEDKIIKNRDARVLRGENGDIVFLYSFPDKETLIITTNELTFNEISDRLVTSRF